jgi:glycosyltransferase involved in cell wall biosynthesis
VFLPLATLLRIPAVLWVDGFEWERAKWGKVARFFHRRIADPIAAVLHRSLVADAPTIAEYYRSRYGKTVACIRYGARDVSGERDGEVLRRLELDPDKYCLFVGRLTPEKEVHVLLEAYRLVRTDWPLVIVGDNPYDARYVARLQEAADPRVRFVGPQFGPAYRALLADAAVSIHPSRVEGTSPALITALASGRAAVVSDIPENRQAAHDAAVFFPVGDAAGLAAALQELIDDPQLRANWAERGKCLAAERFSWEVSADQFAALYRSLWRAGGTRKPTRGGRATNTGEEGSESVNS